MARTSECGESEGWAWPITFVVHRSLRQTQHLSLLDDERTSKRLAMNHRRNKEQDHTPKLDAAAQAFRYADCKTEYWNPERFSFLYGTPLWHEATAAQRVLLNQLYWVGYYAQIISAEIATIYFNQTCAAGLYALEDFRAVCDTLDLESSQERAHINAFKTVSEAVEAEVFGERVFTYPMRPWHAETMIFNDAGPFRRAWKKMQLQAFSLVSASNPFLACQYFTVRGLRTLKGKIVQHELSQYYVTHPDQANAPVPSKISYFHFLDESFHFNSSCLIGHEVINSLPKPTRFEAAMANMGIAGCQKDHYPMSIGVNGLFWHDPALYPITYKILRSKAFGFDDVAAKEMIRRCFTEETDGLQLAHQTHHTAIESYKAYLANLDYVSAHNKEMALMSQSTIERYLKTNRRAFDRFVRGLELQPERSGIDPKASLPAAA